jgi:hypothetical protein
MESIFGIFGNNNEINLKMEREKNYKLKESLYFCIICNNLLLQFQNHKSGSLSSIHIPRIFCYIGFSQPNDDVLEPTRKKNKGKKPINFFEPSVKIQVRKPCQPNWEHGEIIALVVAKKKEHMANI